MTEAFFCIGGITLHVVSDVAFSDESFDRKLRPFRVGGPGEDTVRVHHHHLDDLPEIRDWGEEIYRRLPWAIHRTPNGYLYRALPTGREPASPTELDRRVVLFNEDHTRGDFYHSEPYLQNVEEYGFHSLTLLSSDQILLARLLAARRGLMLHASGVILDGRGFLFVGHSTAGKSTMVKMLQDHAEILCDDRIIVRQHEEGFRIYGTWSHGEVDLVSPSDAPLAALFVLEKGKQVSATPMREAEASKDLWRYTVRPLMTEDWVQATWDVLEAIPAHVPCYRLVFDLSGRVVRFLRDWRV